MTGAIFPLLARVATGKLRPLARLSDVKALDDTCDAPLTTKKRCGMFGVPPASFIPTNPTATLAIASRNCRNHACVNFSPPAGLS